MRKPVCNKFTSHQEAEAWEIRHYQEMSPEERFQIITILKTRVYGMNTFDVRECCQEQKSSEKR